MTTNTDGTGAATSGRNALFASLIGLVGVVVLLQGLWAGIFLEHDGKRESADTWIRIHANGAEVAIALAIAATVVAFVRRRARKDLWVGGIILTVLLVAESWIGGLIRKRRRGHAHGRPRPPGDGPDGHGRLAVGARREANLTEPVTTTPF
jgi:uncharacterized membrane protein